jgi:hypothetical protein
VARGDVSIYLRIPTRALDFRQGRTLEDGVVATDGAIQEMGKMGTGPNCGEISE